MFAADEVRLEVSFTAAQARLANLIRGGSLVSASQHAYGEGITGLARVGPLGSAPGLSRIVAVQFGELLTRGDTAVLALRWEALGPGGGLFPALDADITLAPAAAQATVLTMAGAYRPPLGSLGAWLDRAMLRRAAAATIRSFTSRVAAAIAGPARAAGPGREIAGLETSWLPRTPEMQ
jgi:hypothetical protein